MKINLIGKHKPIINQPFTTHKYQAWPTVAKLKNGKIVAGASAFRISHICPFGKTVIAYSDENGTSFTPPVAVIDTPLDDRDAGLCPFGESGLIVTSFNNTVAFQRKINAERRKEGSPERAYVDAYLNTVSEEDEKKYLGNTFRISYDNGVTFGEIYKSPITSPHGPVELSDGRVLWVGKADAEEQIYVYEINTENGSMEYVSTINLDGIKALGRIPCEPYMIQLDDGSLLCHIRAHRYTESEALTIYQCVSVDGGKSWSIPNQIIDDCDGAPPHIMKHSSGLLVATYSHRRPPYSIMAMFSRDGGKTWDKNYPLYSNNVSWDLGYPSTVELADGNLLTVFYATDAKGEPARIFAQKWNFEE